MKLRYVLIVILICAVAFAGYTFAKGKLAGQEEDSSAKAAQTQESLVCIFYANTYLSIDSNGVVCSNNSQKPDGLPCLEGMEFSKLTFGKPAQSTDKAALDYALKIASCLRKHEIEADSISYSNRMASIHIGKLEVKLGKNEKTEDKINDLSNFIDKVLGSDGVLYMQNANANNYGYTFRAN